MFLNCVQYSFWTHTVLSWFTQLPHNLLCSLTTRSHYPLMSYETLSSFMSHSVHHSCLTWYTHVSLGSIMSHLVHSCLTWFTHVSLGSLMSHLVHSCLPSFNHVSLGSLMSHFVNSWLTSFTHGFPSLTRQKNMENILSTRQFDPLPLSVNRWI